MAFSKSERNRSTMTLQCKVTNATSSTQPTRKRGRKEDVIPNNGTNVKNLFGQTERLGVGVVKPHTNTNVQMVGKTGELGVGNTHFLTSSQGKIVQGTPLPTPINISGVMLQPSFRRKGSNQITIRDLKSVTGQKSTSMTKKT